MNSDRLLPRPRVGRRNRSSVTILDDRDLAAMFDLVDAAAIEAELRRRGIRYHVSAGRIYATAADVLATFNYGKQDANRSKDDEVEAP